MAVGFARAGVLRLSSLSPISIQTEKNAPMTTARAVALRRSGLDFFSETTH
jgi:hypothetical protein